MSLPTLPRPSAADVAAGQAVARLLAVMRALRNPETGCPWDRGQDFASIAPFTIEEAYEVADAVAHQDWPQLQAELGDLLLQVAYHAQLAAEAGLFDAQAVAEGITAKMVRRHPHVFAGARVPDAAAQTVAWEATKAAERRAALPDGRTASVLDDVPAALPALARAVKLSARAARTGFDWPDVAAVMGKLREEVAELEAELAPSTPGPGTAEELADVLFSLANLARHLGHDPEALLRAGNAKFERRFRAVEQALQLGEGVTRPLAELEAAWQAVKRSERSA